MSVKFSSPVSVRVTTGSHYIRDETPRLTQSSYSTGLPRQEHSEEDCALGFYRGHPVRYQDLEGNPQSVSFWFG